jgi:hypothetical protein
MEETFLGQDMSQNTFYKKFNNIKSLYAFYSSEKEIREFLIDNTDLIDILLNAPRIIEKLVPVQNLALKLTYNELYLQIYIVKPPLVANPIISIIPNLMPQPMPMETDISSKLFDEWFYHILFEVHARLDFQVIFLSRDPYYNLIY